MTFTANGTKVSNFWTTNLGLLSSGKWDIFIIIFFFVSALILELGV